MCEGFIVRCVSDGKRCRQMNSCFALGHVQLDTRVSRGGNGDDSAHCFAECAKQCETAVSDWPLPAVNAGGHKSTAVSDTRQQHTNRQCETSRPRPCGPAVRCRRPVRQVRVGAVREAAGSQGWGGSADSGDAQSPSPAAWVIQRREGEGLRRPCASRPRGRGIRDCIVV